MEAQNPRSRIGGNWTAQLLATRRGAILVAALAAVLAGVLLYVFVQHYKTTSSTPAVVAPADAFVFEATKYIPAGTPASTIESDGLLKRTEVPAKEAVAGAISDPSVIAGEVSAASLASGEQITDADFTRANVTIGAYLTGAQRAIAVPLNASQGLTSYLAEGNTVDVMFDDNGTTTMLAQDVSVLANSGGDVVLRVSDKQALQIASASDTTKVWLTLRPAIDSKDSVSVGSKGSV